MRYSKRQDIPLWLDNLIGLLLIIVFSIAAVVGIGKIAFPSGGCDEGVTTTNTWRIASSDFDAEILWQQRERTPQHNPGLRGGMTASRGRVLYWRQPCGYLWGRDAIVALDVTTGEEDWRFYPGFATWRLFSVSEGYVFVNVDSAGFLNDAGELIWQKDARQTELPVRMIGAVEERESDLYFYGDTEVYRVSAETGDVLEVFQQDNRQRPFGDFTPGYPFSERYQDAIRLYYDYRTVEAYALETGDRIWSIDEHFIGLPFLLGNRLILFYSGRDLGVYSVENGELLGVISLNRSGRLWATPNPEVYPPAWITGYDDTVFIRDLEAQELLAVRINFDQ